MGQGYDRMIKRLKDFTIKVIQNYNCWCKRILLNFYHTKSCDLERRKKLTTKYNK